MVAAQVAIANSPVALFSVTTFPPTRIRHVTVPDFCFAAVKFGSKLTVMLGPASPARSTCWVQPDFTLPALAVDIPFAVEVLYS